MANYKVVDAEQLDNDLTSVADAIREKSGTDDSLAFPEGFVSAVEGIIQNGEEVYQAPVSKIWYKPHTVVDGTWSYLDGPTFQNATELITYYDTVTGLHGAQKTFYGCIKLETIEMTKCTGFWLGNTGVVANTPALKKVTLGSIGVSVSRMDGGLRNGDFTVELYVDAETIADIAASVTNHIGSNWTIVYRNSTTGEVITE